MRKQSIVTVGALLALVGSAGCTIQREQPYLEEGQDVPLTILHTADIHSRLLPYDLQPLKSDRDLGLSPDLGPFGGVARLAALIERERAKSDRVVHLDSGDVFQGAPIFNNNLGQVEMRWLSLMGVDAMVVGNHEFDAGAQNFYDQASRWATFPFLAANYDFRDPAQGSVAGLRDFVRPYNVVNAKGLRIGIIGAGDIGSLNSIVAEGNSLGIVPTEQNETIRSYVDYLRPQTDLVVVLSHLGLTDDVELIKGYERTFFEKDVKHLLTREDPKERWAMVEDLSPGDSEGPAVFRIPGVRDVDVIMGGHLHVVLNPPQVLVDPDGREVVLAHSGAFAKYLGRLDLVLKSDERGREHGFEVKSHRYHPFPIDAGWCVAPEDRRVFDAMDTTGKYEQFVQAARVQCPSDEHLPTLRLLNDFTVDLNQNLDLPQIFAYAPRIVPRRNTSTGGDAPLGNLTAEAMRLRKRVEAEFAITNTLGIRDAIYPGPVNVETMFNVFPFENTITVMYLSGTEVQELLDYVAERSAGRGCQSQAQVAGVRFIMDCGQVLANEHLYECEVPEDCPNYDSTGETGINWQCNNMAEGKRCYAHPARNITVNGDPIDPGFSYKVATNDYIARGGSGFRVLARNTTQFDTGVPMRDGLVDYIQNFCTCRQLLESAAAGHEECNTVKIDPIAVAACQTMEADPDSANSGKCPCGQMKAELDPEYPDNNRQCGQITPAMQAFCSAPLDVPVIVGVEDDRINRRVVDRSVTQ